ncbi:MAG: GNAT family N-acetyltransferase [Candidatus Thorarchaeota archaeon]
MVKKHIKANDTYENIVLQWGREFMLEALPDRKPDLVEHSLRRFKDDLHERRVFLLLDNNKPVSMTPKGRESPNSVVFNNVYTRPSLRRKGYAIRCVATLSKCILDEGNKFCFLFTDLSYPTSNCNYQKICYRLIIDIDECQFIKI